MNNKRLVIGMLMAMAVLLGWPLIVNQWMQKHPEYKAAPPPQATTEPAPVAPATIATTTTASTQVAPILKAPGLRATIGDRAPAPTVVLGDELKHIPVKLTIDPQGAALSGVMLNEPSGTGKGKYVFQQ